MQCNSISHFLSAVTINILKNIPNWFPAPLSLQNIVSEEKRGLSSLFIVKCNCCRKLNNVNSSGHHRTGSRGPKADDINTRAVLGSLHADIGLTQLNNFFFYLC